MSAKPLAAASQPFVLQLRRAAGPMQWPWGWLAFWSVAAALALVGLAGWQQPRRARRRAEGLPRLIVDAMSSFGAIDIDARETPFDAVVAASGKCLEGVPGMGFVIIKRSTLEQCEGNWHSLSMDLYDQWVYMEKTTQWRFTPPTHVVAALDQAIAQYVDEGGLQARGARYARNCKALIEGLATLGLRPFLDASIQAPIIVTFHAPADANYNFKAFYQEVKKRGYILYPGKLTQLETFRVGCMGHFGEAGIPGAVAAVADTLAAMGIKPRASAMALTASAAVPD